MATTCLPDLLDLLWRKAPAEYHGLGRRVEVVCADIVGIWLRLLAREQLLDLNLRLMYRSDELNDCRRPLARTSFKKDSQQTLKFRQQLRRDPATNKLTDATKYHWIGHFLSFPFCMNILQQLPRKDLYT